MCIIRGATEQLTLRAELGDELEGVRLDGWRDTQPTADKCRAKTGHKDTFFNYNYM